MAITAAMVKELREMTGAGMMDCKKALTETNGDMDAAVDVLKKSGAAKMEKKQSRIAAEGIARVAVNGNVAVVAEVNSETDFVATHHQQRPRLAITMRIYHMSRALLTLRSTSLARARSTLQSSRSTPSHFTRSVQSTL